MTSHRMRSLASFALLALSTTARAQPAPARTCAAATVTPSAADNQCEARPPPASDEVPDVASLKAPESPAFMAIGVVPTQIQRPTTPTGLAASLANGFANGGTLALAQNFALEVTPYWLAQHRDVTFAEWQDQRGRAWYRNASLSLATGSVETDTASGTPGAGSSEKLKSTTAAAGLRTTIWPGHASRGALACRAFLESYALGRSSRLANFVNERMEAWTKEHPRPQIEPPPAPEQPKDLSDSTVAAAYVAALREWQLAAQKAAHAMPELVAWTERRDAALESATDEFQKVEAPDDTLIERCLADVHARAGFVIDAAMAYALRLPNADFAQLDSNGASSATGWLTAGYIIENLRRAASGRALEGSVLGLFRLQREDGHVARVERDLRRYDVGVRFALAARRLGVAVEGTLRKQLVLGSSPADDLLYRVAVNIDYRLYSGMWLSAAFGKDFGDLSAHKPVLALANLQWAFGTTRSVSPDSFKTAGGPR